MRRFITFEGIEGSGKTTQIRLVSESLRSRGVDHLLTREPGGTPAGDAIRSLALRPGVDLGAACEMFLYAAARAEHLARVIRPALDAGRLVLCDRYADATVAYQGHGRGLGRETVERLGAFEALAVRPDRTILLDLEPAAALARARRRDRDAGAVETRFEAEDLAFHARVREGYLDSARREPDRIAVVDARGGVDQVRAAVALTLMGWM